jgi:hypothetical protein
VRERQPRRPGIPTPPACQARLRAPTTGKLYAFAHYHQWHCHQALDMDCPESRPIQSRERGAVVEVTERGGLYRHYERRAT